MNFESLVQTATLSLATAIEAIAGGLIALAVAKAIVLSLRARYAAAEQEIHAARELLGSWLSFALEFEVAADILRGRSAFVLRAESTERAGLS